MTELEVKRTKLELIKVQAARAQLEFTIEERLDEINRLKGHIDIQIKREKELNEILNKK